MLCNKLTREESNDLYGKVLQAYKLSGDPMALRRLCREDLFFLLTIAFKRKDINCDWLYARCREVEASPDGHLDLWAREHYKSTIITYGKSIQDILASHGDNPLPAWGGQEVTIGIFSHTRPIAKAFLTMIKREFEDNEFLKDLFPDVLYTNPKSEASTWSLDNGINVKRKSNSNCSTVEAHGLVDGQPTGKHFVILNYDDVVTISSVTTPDQIKKVTECWRLSLNLGAHGGYRRIIGTRYHFNDTYRTMIKQGSVKVRTYPATHDGKITGRPVFLTEKALTEKRRDFGPYVFACQMLQNPAEDSVMGFQETWLRYYDKLNKNQLHDWNFYITVDPASKKKKARSNEPDYTVIEVNAKAPDGNWYLIDAVRDRMNLTERTDKLFEFVVKYQPIAVGYEQYGMQADVEHIEYEMEIRNYRFNITELGGSMAKEDRIRRLVPVFEQGRYWMPHTLMFIDREGKQRDYVAEFLEDEYGSFPVSIHDDMLDCKSRIMDPMLEVKVPKPQETKMPSMTMEDPINTVETEYDVFA